MPIPLRLILAAVLLVGALWVPTRYGDDLVRELKNLQTSETVEGVVLGKSELFRRRGSRAASAGGVYRIRVRYGVPEAGHGECEVVATGRRFKDTAPGHTIRIRRSQDDAGGCLAADDLPGRRLRLYGIGFALLLVIMLAILTVLSAARLRSDRGAPEG